MIKFKDGKIQIDLFEILKQVPKEQRCQLIEELSCDSEIIKFVTQQILDRWTENMSCGSHNIIAHDTPYSGLDQAWRSVAKRSSEVSKREIERLEEALKLSKEESNKLREELSEKYYKSRGQFVM